MVTINKQSKKNQKKYNSTKRLSWGMLNPATKVFKTKNRRDEAAKERGRNYE